MTAAIPVVAAILVDGDGRVLLAQRPPGRSLAGSWEFPGGKIEAGESPETALRREMREELRIGIEIEARLGRYSHQYNFGLITLEVFVARPLEPPRPTAAVQNFRWCAPNEIDLTTLCPADVEPWRDFFDRRSIP